ncbi:MAG TPA: hypothetical protein VHM28_07095 [Anaerolineales bacterium]|jgi:ABC-type uncharacterized transport system permease subunit|nr:hypothetical protein [Anaerolineales bacterium]
MSSDKNTLALTSPADFDYKSRMLSIKLSILLSALYAVVGVFLFCIINGEAILFPIALIVGAPFITFVAIFPSIIVGFLTGRIISRLAESDASRRLSSTVFALISMLICGLIAFLIHVMFEIKIDFSFEAPVSYLSFGFLQTYPFSFGIPSIIYILAGGWFGSRIYPRA